MDKTRMPTLTIVLQSLARVIRQLKEIREIQTAKEEDKLFADDMIEYISDPKFSPENSYTFSKVPGYKLIFKNWVSSCPVYKRQVFHLTLLC